MAYPYQYLSFSPSSGSFAENETSTIKIIYNTQLTVTVESAQIVGLNSGLGLRFYDSAGNSLGSDVPNSGALSCMSIGYSGNVATITVNLAQYAGSMKDSAAYFSVRGVLKTYLKTNVNYGEYGSLDLDYEDDVANNIIPKYGLIHYADCGAPTSPAVLQTLSRGAVKLSWGAGSEGTNNSVTGYDVQRRESTDGSSWGSWATVPGSPVTGTSLDVTPPGTVGNYYQYQVRTRGSAGSDYYSGWVTSTNTLRRKWDAFGAWTDATLTAGVSSIRAVHMTQLQERVNAIRTFLGMSACSFTAITPGVTKIAQWAAHIREIRDAIDEITTDHEAWQALETGKPRAAQITQLRSIVEGL